MAAQGHLGKKQLVFLKVLCYLTRKQQRQILRIIGESSSLIRCICECALNVLKGNVSLTVSEKKNCDATTTFDRKTWQLGNQKSPNYQTLFTFLTLLIQPILHHFKHGACKKMILIDHDDISRLGSGVHDRHPGARSTAPADSAKHTGRSVQTNGTPLSRLDTQMYEILNSDAYESEREKYTAYLQTLQRYLHLARRYDDSDKQLTSDLLTANVPLVTKQKKDENLENEDMDTTIMTEAIKSRLNDTLIIDSVPKKFHSKAKMLLRNLHRSNSSGTDKISWDTNDVVTIADTRIPNSNIVDLVNDAMRLRKRAKPAGKAHFTTHLRKIPIPQEFIGNPEIFQEPIVIEGDTSAPRKNSKLLKKIHGDDDNQAISVSSSGGSSNYEESRGGDSSTSHRSILRGESTLDNSTRDKRSFQQGHGQRGKHSYWLTLKL